jgi:hypothetical protein
MMAGMARRRPVSIVVGAGALFVAAVLVGGQVLAGAIGAGPHGDPPAPAVSSGTAGADDECVQDAEGECGNDHSRAIRKWVECKAAKGKSACAKPAPPGRALGHTKHSGVAPGPASTDGQGHAWGRAHAPGQLKVKVKQEGPEEPKAD